MLGRLGSMQHAKGYDEDDEYGEDDEDDEDNEDDEDAEDAEGGQRDAGHMMMTLIPLKSNFIRR